MNFGDLTDSQQKNVDKLTPRLKKLTSIINDLQTTRKDKDPSYDMKRLISSVEYYSRLLSSNEETRIRKLEKIEEEYQRIKKETQDHLSLAQERLEREKNSKSRSQLTAERELKLQIQEWKNTLPIPIPRNCLPENWNDPDEKEQPPITPGGIIKVRSETPKPQKKKVEIQESIPSSKFSRQRSDSDDSMERHILQELMAPIISEEEAVKQSRISRGLEVKQEVKITPSLPNIPPPIIKKKAVKAVPRRDSSLAPSVLTYSSPTDD